MIALYALYVGFSVLITLFLEFCLRKGHIFEDWLDWIAYLWMKANNRIDIIETAWELEDSELEDLGYDSPRDYMLSTIAEEWKWIRPLGFCTVCFNPYISLLILPPFVWAAIAEEGFNGFQITAFVFSILLSNFLVRYFLKRIV